MVTIFYSVSNVRNATKWYVVDLLNEIHCCALVLKHTTMYKLTFEQFSYINFGCRNFFSIFVTERCHQCTKTCPRCWHILHAHWRVGAGGNNSYPRVCLQNTEGCKKTTGKPWSFLAVNFGRTARDVSARYGTRLTQQMSAVKVPNITCFRLLQKNRVILRNIGNLNFIILLNIKLLQECFL